MKSSTQKITVSAVAAALAAPCIILTNFVPLSVTLLTVAAVCYYIVFEKAGIGFGFLSIAAAGGLSFLGGVAAAQILNLVLFVPYSVLAFFLRKLTFGKIKHMIIRAVIVAAFAALIFIPIFYLAALIAAGIINISGFVGSIGYAWVTVLFAIILVAVDIMFSQICNMICKRIKIGKSGSAPGSGTEKTNFDNPYGKDPENPDTDNSGGNRDDTQD